MIQLKHALLVNLDIKGKFAPYAYQIMDIRHQIRPVLLVQLDLLLLEELHLALTLALW